MKTIKHWIVAGVLALQAAVVQAADFEMSFKPKKDGGQDDYILAAYVISPSGDYVDMLGIWGNKNSYFKKFVELKRLTGAVAYQDFGSDVRINSTRKYSAGETLKVTWDLKDENGNKVPNGTYKIAFEQAFQGSVKYDYVTFDFKVGGAAMANETVPNMGRVTAIKVTSTTGGAGGGGGGGGGGGNANNAPVAHDKSLDITDVRSFNVKADDADGDSLTYKVISQPAKGTLSGNAPSLTYTPPANESGTVAFKFVANDGTVDSAPGTVTINYDTTTGGGTGGGATASGNLELTVTPENYGGGNSYIFAIYVTKPNGEYVDMLGIWGKNNSYFKKFKKLTAATGANAYQNFSSDVRMGNTRSFKKDAAVTVKWDLKDENGTAVPAGNYKICFEAASMGAVKYGYETLDFEAGGPSMNNQSLGNINWIKNIKASYAGGSGGGGGGGGNSNNAPVAQDKTLSITGAKSFNIKATDADGDNLTYTVVSQPAKGTLSGNAPNLTYTPPANQTGTATFKFVANDGTVDSAPATVTINYTASGGGNNVDGKLVVKADAEPLEGKNAHYFGIYVIDSNDKFVKMLGLWGQKNSYFKEMLDLVRYTNANRFEEFDDAVRIKTTRRAISAGVETVEWDLTDENGNTVPNGNYQIVFEVTPNGRHQTKKLDFQVGGPALINKSYPDMGVITKISLDYDPGGVNTIPVADDKSRIVRDGAITTIALSGSDADGEALTFRVISQPTLGVLSGTAPNMVYSPPVNNAGNDSFTYVANDGRSDSALATVSIDLRFADSDNDGMPNAWESANGVSNPAGDPDNDGMTNLEEFLAGTDPKDANSKIDVSVIVGHSTEITLAGDATDADGDELAFSVIEGPAWLNVAADGRLTGTPSSADEGDNSWTVKVIDHRGGSDTATLEIQVGDVPGGDFWVDAGQDLTVKTPTGTKASITLEATGEGADNYRWKETLADNSVVSVGDGKNITIDAAIGIHTYTVRLKNDAGEVVRDSVVVTVEEDQDGPNTAPEFKNATVLSTKARKGKAFNKDISGKATDADGDSLTFSKVDGANWLSVAGNGKLTGTPSASDKGNNIFTVKVSDGKGGSDTAKVKIRVK